MGSESASTEPNFLTRSLLFEIQLRLKVRTKLSFQREFGESRVCSVLLVLRDTRIHVKCAPNSCRSVAVLLQQHHHVGHADFR